MPLTLINPNGASDAGGVAGRRGYRYQDHVGAAFVIHMLQVAELVQVEFETADDIVLRWQAQSGSVIEYVQVKTTESDTKWSLKELLARVKTRIGTSVAERSLACDKHAGAVQFRIVSQRDVGKPLKPLTVERLHRRAIQLELDNLAAKVGNRYKTVKSPTGRTLKEWAAALYWQVHSNESALINTNVNQIIRLAEQFGEIPSHSQATTLYNDLARIVGEAADASSVSRPDDKAVSRRAATEWWKFQLDKLRDQNRPTVKVYRVATKPFFSELHSIHETDVRRYLDAYDVEFDRGKWRSSELIEYLIDWLPEISLPARVISEFSHLDARGLTARAASALDGLTPLEGSRLFAELLLHAVLRHFFKSEPIACKVFYGGRSGRGRTSAHIVQGAGGDQLWIGRARVTSAETHDEVIAAVIEELEMALSKDILIEERNIIIQLREPRHMRATNLDAALGPNGKADDLLRCLKLPVLIAYDSEVIGGGFTDEYLNHLRDEVMQRYTTVKQQFAASLREAEIHIFLIPLENATSLVTKFNDQLQGT